MCDECDFIENQSQKFSGMIQHIQIRTAGLISLDGEVRWLAAQKSRGKRKAKHQKATRNCSCSKKQQ
jgi:hypothetical protein